jgi:tRNA (guanine-N7-)-methyltransferase
MILDGSVQTFARRKSGTPAQRRALQTFTGIPFTNAPLDYRTVFGNDHPVYAEIGFGMGSATALIAEKNPGNNYLGIEVFDAGVGKLWMEIQKRGLQNLRIIKHDAIEVVTHMIPSRSLAGFHIFFPDPWPKKRHHKRRLIQRPVTDVLADRLAGNGYIYMVTDWAPYAGWALDALRNTPCLTNAYEEYAPRLDWRPETEFEKKASAQGRPARALYFVKRP